MNREALMAVAVVPLPGRAARVSALRTTLRIGVHTIQAFEPGMYWIGARDIVPAADDRAARGGVVDVDSGAIVVTDLDALPSVAKALTWERYDALFGPTGDAKLADLLRELGPRFAILFGDASRPFAGDGSYRLAPGAPASHNDR